jgi:hypothetical protein
MQEKPTETLTLDNDALQEQAEGKYYHKPLRCTLNQGKFEKGKLQPLKTSLAEKFPQLTRKQRRQLLRDARKAGAKARS